MGDWTRDSDVPLMGRVKGGGFRLSDQVTLTVNTAAYAAGDVLSDTQAVTGFFALTDGIVLLDSVQVLDEADQGTPFDIVFLNASSSLGTINSAPNITDANARNVIGKVSIAAADYVDLGGSKVATVSNLAQVIKAAAGTTTLYFGAINGSGTPTYAAATDLKVRFGFRE